MERAFLEGLRVGEEQLPQAVIDAILEESGKEAGYWEEQLAQAAAAHEKQVKDMEFAGTLHAAIAQARGRNAKAITALLDVDALREAPDGVEGALEELKKEHGYLFEQVPVPLYARGTGARTVPKTAPTTLAGALKERFEKKR